MILNDKKGYGFYLCRQEKKCVLRVFKYKHFMSVFLHTRCFQVLTKNVTLNISFC